MREGGVWVLTLVHGVDGQLHILGKCLGIGGGTRQQVAIAVGHGCEQCLPRVSLCGGDGLHTQHSTDVSSRHSSSTRAAHELHTSCF